MLSVKKLFNKASSFIEESKKESFVLVPEEAAVFHDFWDVLFLVQTIQKCPEIFYTLADRCLERVMLLFLSSNDF